MCTTGKWGEEEVIENAQRIRSDLDARRDQEEQTWAPRKRYAITRILKKATKLKYFFQSLEEKKSLSFSNNINGNNTYKELLILRVSIYLYFCSRCFIVLSHLKCMLIQLATMLAAQNRPAACHNSKTMEI